jgi:HEPN domain-containing protein
MRDKVSLQRLLLHWTSGADEDLLAAKSLINKRYYRQGLFLAHLSVEKYLKAIITRTTGAEAPYLHNLVRLAEIAGVDLPTDWDAFVRAFNVFNLTGRYPWQMSEEIEDEEAKQRFKRAEEFLQWLKSTYSI